MMAIGRNKHTHTHPYQQRMPVVMVVHLFICIFIFLFDSSQKRDPLIPTMKMRQIKQYKLEFVTFSFCPSNKSINRLHFYLIELHVKRVHRLGSELGSSNHYSKFKWLQIRCELYENIHSAFSRFSN